jgi:glutamate racemase
VRFALVDSGLGVLPAAAALRRELPDAELVLSIDPDGMPWGPRDPDDIAARALACARAALPYAPDVLIFACNTASVQALARLRDELEAIVPVVGTVPAVKPAAAGGEPVAVWATVATTGSAYQTDLIDRFAGQVPVARVACPGLADAVDAGDAERVAAAITAAAAQTPSQTRAIVLGCTQYELAAETIAAAVPQARVLGSAAAVAAQAQRRVASRRATPDASSSGGAALLTRPALHVLLSGRSGELPAAALGYAEGRLIAASS